MRNLSLTQVAAVACSRGFVPLLASLPCTTGLRWSRDGHGVPSVALTSLVPRCRRWASFEFAGRRSPHHVLPAERQRRVSFFAVKRLRFACVLSAAKAARDLWLRLACVA